MRLIFSRNVTGNVTGQVSGSAGSADKRPSATNFTMAGEVQASIIIFDIQTGGTTKTFPNNCCKQFYK